MIIEARDEDFAALLAGAPPRALRLPEGSIESEDVLGMLRRMANRVRADFAPAAWMIVELDEVVGLCSIKALPAPGVIDIGYGVAPSRRNQGVATRGVADVLDWAQADARISAVHAETSIHNTPSQRVLERNGFHQIGARTDADDGDLLCWRRSLGRPLPAEAEKERAGRGRRGLFQHR
jgi:RimJ/RimL family protein N-acetyltransferase